MIPIILGDFETRKATQPSTSSESITLEMGCIRRLHLLPKTPTVLCLPDFHYRLHHVDCTIEVSIQKRELPAAGTWLEAESKKRIVHSFRQIHHHGTRASSSFFKVRLTFYHSQWRGMVRKPFVLFLYFFWMLNWS